MKKVLFYVEPHPIRGYFSEFYDPAVMFYNLACHKNFLNIEWRIFSNSFILSELSGYISSEEKKNNDEFLNIKDHASFENSKNNHFIYPDEFDERQIKGYLKKWDEEEVQFRNDLVLGKGELTDFYISVLKKIYSSFQFTHLVLWSENGAVRKFCQENNISVIHMELGPTRSPFQPTIMMDPCGTNANASINRISTLPRIKQVDSYLWASDFTHYNSLSVKEIYQKRGVVLEANSLDGDILITSDDFSYQENMLNDDPVKETYLLKKFVVLSLQLADDLNTINHSTFDSPKDFVQFIVPKLLNMGFDICIKRHPGSSLRIFNLIKEIEAIDYAKNLSNKVKILSSNVNQNDFILLCKKAQAIVSINSSVCFESWVIGVPGLIYGDAIYNFNKNLTDFSNNFLEGSLLLNDHSFIEDFKSKINYSLNSYFIPNDNAILSKSLAKIVNDYIAKNGTDYFEWLHENVDFFEMLMDDKLSKISEKFNTTQKLNLYESVSRALENDGLFQYTIDESKLTNSEIKIRGWIISEVTKPYIIFMEYDGELFIADNHRRDDVKKHFPYAHDNSGFEFNEKIINKINGMKEIKIFILDSDQECRYILI